MYYFTLEDLRRLLDLKEPESVECVTTYSDHGHGRISLIQRILEDDVNCIEHRDAMPPDSPLPKIIVSDPFLTIRPPSSEELSLFAALTTHIQVYLWPGFHAPFANAKLVKSGIEFWEKRDQLMPATEHDIKKCLDLQGISANDFIILDHAAYEILLHKIHKTNLETPIVNLEQLNMGNDEELTKLMAGIDQTKPFILQLTQPSKEYLEWLSTHISSMAKIAIKSRDPMWIADNILDGKDNPNLSHCKMLTVSSVVQRRLNNTASDLAIYSENSCDLETINYEKCEIADSIIFKNLSYLQSISIEDTHFNKSCAQPAFSFINLTQLTNLKVSIRKNTPLPYILFNNTSHLKKLSLENVNYIQDGMYSFLLEHFTLVNFAYMDLKRINNLKTLKVLELSNCRNTSQFEFNEMQLPLLEELSISAHEQTAKKPLSINDENLPKLNHLALVIPNETITAVYIDHRNLVELDIESKGDTHLFAKNCDKLKRLSLKGKWLFLPFKFNATILKDIEVLELEGCDLGQFDFSQCKNLKKLVLKNCTSSIDYNEMTFAKLDFSSLQNLQELHIEDCRYLDELKLPENSHLTSFILNSKYSIEPASRQIDQKLIKLISGLDFSKLSLVKHLSIPIVSQHQLVALAGLKELITLEIVYLSQLFFGILEIKQLLALYSLVIHSTCDLIKLSQLPQLENLTLLTIDAVSTIIPRFQVIDCPKILRFNSKSPLRDNTAIPDIPTLQELTVESRYCKKLQSSQPSQHIKRLEIVGEHYDNYNEADKADTLELSRFAVLEDLRLIHGEVDVAVDNKIVQKISDLPKLKSLSSEGLLSSCQTEVADCLELRSISALDFNSDLSYDRCPRLRAIERGVVVSSAENIPSQSQYPQLLTDSEIALDRVNKNSPVSYFSLQHKKVPDANTSVAETPRYAEGKFRVELHTPHGPAVKNYFRVNIFDKVIFDEKKGEIAFVESNSPLEEIAKKIPDFNTNDMSTFMNNLKTSMREFELGHLSGYLNKGESCPIISDHPDVEPPDIFCNPKNAVKLSYDDDKQQFKIQAQVSGHIEVLYLVKQNNDYNQKANPKVEKLIVVDPAMLLPANLIVKLKEILKDNNALAFLFDNRLTPEHKIEQLTQYCKFDAIALDKKPKESFNALMSAILNRRGVCRHSAQAFILLAQFIGVPARFPDSEMHEFIEIPYRVMPDGKKINWHMRDLGGGTRLDLTPAGKRESIFANLPAPTPITKSLKKPAALLAQKSSDISTPANTASSAVPLPDLNPQGAAARPALMPETIASRSSALLLKIEAKLNEPDENQLEEIYYQKLKALVQKDELHTIKQILENNALVPLIVREPQQSAFTINEIILQQIKPLGVKHLFINSPKEFEQFFKPSQVANGKVKKITGPLNDLINNGGVLVVNWTNFTAKEMGTYQSLLERKPTLFGQPVSTKLRVIGISDALTKKASAFLSRCKSWELHAKFLQSLKHTVPLTLSSNVKVEPVDVFTNSGWREKLLGQIIMHGKVITLREGPLIKAIREGQPFVIHNPPVADKDFDLLMYRIQVERKLLFNGELLELNDKTIIQTAIKTHPDLPDLPIYHEHEFQDELPKRRMHYLNISNFHECFERITIDEKTYEVTNSTEGLLAQYQAGDVFYITGKILAQDWEELRVKIKEKYAGKKFEFVLAPGASIVNIKSNIQAPICQAITSVAELPSTINTIFSNDPDYLAKQLAQQQSNDNKKPHIINVSPQTELSDLIAEIKILHSDKDEVNTEILYKKQGMLKALMETLGRTIILNGELSLQVYQQLLSLLAGKPNIYTNGVRLEKEITGRLISVMPSTAKLKVHAMQSVEKEYQFADYYTAFPTDKALLLRIEQFYHWASKLSQRTVGSPKKSEVFYYQLQNMLRALKTGKLHPHNPIKGHYHYDYPDYAYLNVMAKYCLCPEDKTTPRIAKLKQIILAHNIQLGMSSELTPYIWDILNCYNGADCREILGEDLSFAIDDKSTPPSLTATALNRLFTKIKKDSEIMLTPQQKIEQKAQKQLEHLLFEQHSKLIFMKGMPGTSKTFTADNLEDDARVSFHKGKEKIRAWLTDESKLKKILFLDEFNLAEPGTWDFLKGISIDGKTVYFEGEFFELTEDHCIVAAGNPETFPKRSHHPFFQQHAEIIYFKETTHEYLTKNILQPLLRPYQLEEHTQNLLGAYYLIQQKNPQYIYTMRDVQNLAQRFICLVQNKGKQIETSELFRQACMAEFAGNIESPTQRQQFYEAFASKFGIKHPVHLRDNNLSSLIEINDKISLPQEKRYILDVIEQDLLLMERMKNLVQAQAPSEIKKETFMNNNTDNSKIVGSPLESKEAPINVKEESGKDNKPNENKERSKKKLRKSIYYKQCIVIEGDPGIGKSTLIPAILDKQGVQYEVIAVGTKETRAKIIEAYNNKKKIILDEFNIDEDIEDLLIELLEKENPDFMVFATQNSSDLEGRKPLSPAIRNRTHFIYMDKYSEPEMASLAEKHQLNPTAFTRAHKRAQKDFPQINDRTVFTMFEQHMVNKQVLSVRS